MEKQPSIASIQEESSEDEVELKKKRGRKKLDDEVYNHIT